jgi:hypothetical protein
MPQSYFVLTLSGFGFILAAGAYAYAFSLAGPTGRRVLLLGAPRLVEELISLFWRGRHVAPRQRGVSPVFAGVAGAEGATVAGLQVPEEVSAYQAAADEEARILAGFERIVSDLNDPAGSETEEDSPGWFASFHEETASLPVYRAWVLERTGELPVEELNRVIAAGRELAPA